MVIKSGVPTPADLRALVAQKMVRLYIIAPQVGLNPIRIGNMLNGRVPLPDDVALRILACLENTPDPVESNQKDH